MSDTIERILRVEELEQLDDMELTALRLRYIAELERLKEGRGTSSLGPPDRFQAEGRIMKKPETAIGAIRSVRSLRAQNGHQQLFGELYRAVGALIDNDTDENWGRVEKAYAAVPIPKKDQRNNER